MLQSPRLVAGLRALTAGLLVLGGYVHLHRWQGGYKGIPQIGPLFLTNAIVSFALAGVILFWTAKPITLSVAALQVGTLVGFVLSRTIGVFNFKETTFGSDEGAALAAEIGALVVVAVLLSVRRWQQVHAVATPVEAPGYDSESRELQAA